MARSQIQRRTRTGARARPLPRGAWALLEGHELPELEVVDLESLGDLAQASPLLFEPRLDGARVLVARHAASVSIVSEARRAITRDLDRLVRTIAHSSTLPESFVAEGLLVAVDATGRPSFDSLRRALAEGTGGEILLVLCDLLRVGAEDLSQRPFESRRSQLAGWSNLPASITVMSSLGADFERARRAMLDVKLDGLIARPSGGRAPSTCHVASRRRDEASPSRSLSPAPKLTNATKVLFPRDGFTKQDLFAYYADVAPVILPLMAKRPIVLQRWPDGIDDFMWFQHRVPPRAPDYLRVLLLEGNRRIAIDGPDALLWLVNQAAITFHGFVSREGSFEHPDWLVLDLDPPNEAAWPRVIEVALALRKLLDLLEVESVVKTSGQKGLHILVPLAPRQDATRVKLAGRLIADLIERLLPTLTTQETDRDKRGGRIFLDANQGFLGKTLVLPYSVRGVDGAPISTPLRWEEVTPALRPSAFTLRSTRARLDRVGDLAKPLLSGRTRVEQLLARLQTGSGPP
jgi:DNA ligase D-like protein (predicted polymerase)